MFTNCKKLLKEITDFDLEACENDIENKIKIAMQKYSCNGIYFDFDKYPGIKIKDIEQIISDLKEAGYIMNKKYAYWKVDGVPRIEINWSK